MHVSPLQAEVNEATGGALTTGVTLWLLTLVASLLSVTASVTL